LKVKGRLLGEAGIETKVKSLLGLFLLNDQGGISRIAKARETNARPFTKVDGFLTKFAFSR